VLRPLTAAEAYLEEADQLLDRGDAVQASEKYYKAVEEAVKELAIRHRIRSLAGLKHDR
jgi:hypothetical protein